jgi:hypothetical protein
LDFHLPSPPKTGYNINVRPFADSQNIYLETNNLVEVVKMADLWFYAQNGQQKDPVPSSQLRQLASAGSLRPTDLVWKEGMANWVPANQIPGLFAAAQPAPVPQASYQQAPVPYQQPGGGPQQSKGSYAPTDPYMDEPDEFAPRRKRRKKKKDGPNIGVILGIIGGVVVVLGLVIGGLIWAVNSSFAPRESDSRSWSLKPQDKANYHFTFEKGKFVVIDVKSNANSDVDLAVYDGSSKIAEDTSLSKNCKVSFIANATKSYRVEVWNRLTIEPGRNMSNSGTVSYNQRPPGSKDVPMPFVSPGGPPPFAINPPFNPNPNIPGGGIAPPKTIDQTFNGVLPHGQRQSYVIQLKANTTYIIDAKSPQFDTYLNLEDIATKQVVMSDDDGGVGLNSRIVFNPVQTKSYMIHIRSFGNDDGGAYILTVGH